jgi:hypothetical protein
MFGVQIILFYSFEDGLIVFFSQCFYFLRLCLSWLGLFAVFLKTFSYSFFLNRFFSFFLILSSLQIKKIDGFAGNLNAPLFSHSFVSLKLFSFLYAFSLGSAFLGLDSLPSF